MSIFKEEGKRMSLQEYEGEQQKKKLKRYYKDMEKKKAVIKPFGKIVTDIIGQDTYITFQYKTGLSANMYYDLQGRVGAKSPCKKNTIISFCVGYDTGIEIAEQLFESEGSGLHPHNDVDSAYVMLLTEFRGKSVDECNEILEKLGVPLSKRLGVYAQKTKK